MYIIMYNKYINIIFTINIILYKRIKKNNHSGEDWWNTFGGEGRERGRGPNGTVT